MSNLQFKMLFGCPKLDLGSVLIMWSFQSLLEFCFSLSFFYRSEEQDVGLQDRREELIGNMKRQEGGKASGQPGFPESLTIQRESSHKQSNKREAVVTTGSGPGSSSSAVVIGNVLSGRQSNVSPCPSCRRPTTPPTLRGVSPEGAAVLSEPLDVPIFFAEDGDLVLEKHRVQSHLGVDKRHGAKPAGELVHAGLPLGEMVRVGPAGRPRRLVEEKEEIF
ncbi:hypothetical protein CHARACLAT_013597 [Characodon lateralis]|uniref:Uncharacterized protein n=1 Tax=Characodon lateralis TaxID=208331 RepID=A0ABU7CXW4_9TELE|nr:hypothetical protein [Characodon lateralis]